MTAVANTTPYAWPYDGQVDPTVTALVIAGGGPLWANYVPRDPSASENIGRLRERLAGVLVVVVDHHPNLRRLEPVEAPALELTAADGERAVTAAGIDGFYGSALDAVLRSHGRTHLLVCGNGLETAVHSTVRRANDRGYECLTLVDASVAHDPALSGASRSSIEMSGGIFGAVGTTDDVLDAFAG